jgi:hypothetical protein
MFLSIKYACLELTYLFMYCVMDKLPRKADRTIAEGMFVADYVSPLIHGTLGIDDKNVAIHL